MIWRKNAGQSARMLMALTGVLAASASPAAAQEKQAKNRSTNDAIVVTAMRRDETTQIDRKIFKVETDIQSFTGSAADVLNKIPALDVDTEGRLSLRGDPNVTILIDGKPSGMTGGDALTQLPGKDIARVEVMTNPPAEYKAEGSGGVVNIITKRTREAGVSGSFSFAGGEEGRNQAGLSAAYNTKKFSLSGGLTFKQDVKERRVEETTTVFSPFAASQQTIREKGRRQIPGLKLGADYKFDGGDKLSLSLSRNERFGERTSVQSGDTEDAFGALTRQSSRRGRSNEWRLDHDARADYSRSLFTGKDQLKVSLFQTARRERNDYTTLTDRILPAGDGQLDQYRQNADRTKTEFQTDYELPLSGQTVKVGYDLEHNYNRYNYPGQTTDIVTGAVTPYASAGNDFRYDQWINSAYGSYQTQIGAVDVLAGLRIEQTELDTRQSQGAVRNSTDDLRLYPSLHLEREAGEGAKVSASYSVRTTRPEPEDLNPFIDRRDPRNLRAGNPFLKAKRTQSFELGYERDSKPVSYHATVYYRRHKNVVSELSQALDANTVLVSKVNLPEEQVAGFEIGLNGKLPYHISYNLSGNVYYDEIDPGPFAAGNRSDVTGAGKLSLDYKPSKIDTWQLSVNYTGERLIAQGTVRPVTTVNAGYRHQFSDCLAGVVTVTDLFDGQRQRRVFETPTFRDDYNREVLGQVVSVGFVYNFGGKPKQKEKNVFQYDESQ